MKNTYKTILVVLLAIFGTLLFQGCATSNKHNIVSKELLHVEVTYLDKRILPSNSEVTLLLEDISKLDEHSKVLVKQSLKVKNAPPYTFTLSFDTNSIDFKHAYNLSAYITVNGKYIYRSDAVFNPFSEIREKYKVVLKRLPNNIKKKNTLVDTSWYLLSINGENVKTNKNKQIAYLAFGIDGKSIRGFSGCNNMFGSFGIDGQNIKIGPLASTRKACMNGMDTEAKFKDTINEVKKWHINGNILKLSNENGKNLIEMKSIE